MGLFSKNNKPKEEKFEPTWPPQDPNWARTPKGRFHNLITFDPTQSGLDGLSGVFVIWHGGVKPYWVYVGRADNLANAIDGILDNEEVLSFHRRGGLFVTWSTINKEFQGGVVRYLNHTMKPNVENTEINNTVKPVAVTVPGAKDDKTDAAPAA